MRSFRFSLDLLAALAAGSLPSLAPAQDCGPAMEVILSDLPGEQVQPKVVGTADGGAYVSWFDNATGGYEDRKSVV